MNDDIINLMNGKLSLFSIINDLTMPQQFKDDDIMQGLNSKLDNTKLLKFDKIHKNKFHIFHTQCEVVYNINGFKLKNQDKIND
jgi:myosin heavy subunit